MKTLILLFLFYSQISLATEINIKLDLKNKWSPKEISLIKKAAKVVIQRMGSTTVARCTYRNSWRGKPSEKQWGRFMGVFRRQKKLEIIINKKPYKNRTLAMAKVGIANIDERNDRWRKLEISLNEKRIANQDSTKPNTLDYWANTIAHEIAHNMGLTHGTAANNSWEDNYAGYFVTELGYCVMTNGKHGSDGGDLSIRRIRKKKFHLKGW